MNGLIKCNICHHIIISKLFLKTCPVCNQPLCNECSAFGICPNHFQELAISEDVKNELKTNFQKYINIQKYSFFWIICFITATLILDDYFNHPVLKIGFFIIVILLILLFLSQIEKSYRKWFIQTKNFLEKYRI